MLIVQPYYMAPTPTQAMDHYRRIAEAVSIPIVLYHNVRGTCVNFTTDHLIKLFEEKVIAGVKCRIPNPIALANSYRRPVANLPSMRPGHCCLRRAVPRRARLDLRNPQRRASCCQRTLYRDCHEGRPPLGAVFGKSWRRSCGCSSVRFYLAAMEHTGLAR